MNTQTRIAPRSPDARLDTVIRLAVLAVGGQGGGVLTNWIEALARAQGYACQATSVAGVAQRTGATIYYVEMAPAGDGAPVFSLAPSPGDVDILIAAEMMEAGRAILRGFVTPDRTTLIASTHRALAVSEKSAPGNGIASSDEVRAAAEIAAERLVMFDMERVAGENGSVISSALFGALAGSGALPFGREAFEAAIRASGKGVEASLRSFAAAFDLAKAPRTPPKPQTGPAPLPVAGGPPDLMREWETLSRRAAALPEPVRETAHLGLCKVVDFQDPAYGGEYLDRLERFVALDTPESGFVLSCEAAKHIANAMAYDDVIRVADLKTRAARFDRITAEIGAAGKTLHLTEYMHPRAGEIVGLLPAGLGRRIERSAKLMALVGRVFGGGRRLRTHRIGGFAMLYLLAGLRRYRRRLLRHAYEQESLGNWLETCLSAVPENYDLAVELVRCQRLLKGYSDTRERSQSKFGRVMATARALWTRGDAAQWVARLREAALKDEKGEALDGAIRTIRSFT